MSKIRVLVDGIVFENNSQIGIWRVFYETLNRISDRADVTLWLRAPAVQPLPEGVRIIQDRGRVPVHRRNVPMRVKNKLLAPYSAVKGSLMHRNTIFHSTYFTPCPVEGVYQVTSLNDMIVETHYSIMGGAVQQNADQKHQELIRANRIIAISNSACSDLLRFYPECKGRVNVVRLGSEHLFDSKLYPRPSKSADPFVLFVGHRESYKNFQTLLDAMTRPAWPEGMPLQVVGNPFAGHELRLMRALGLEHKVVHLGRLSDDELRSQYATATCFIFPSLAEGFGLPILEAQINQCPVACSDIDVFHEVAGDGAVYFDPRLGESIADAVRVICNRSVANRLIPVAQANAERFSWDRASEQMLEVYRMAGSRCF